MNIEEPDGTPRMLTDVCRISTLGWCASTALRPGIASIYCSLVDNVARRDVNCASAPARAFS